jgi:hypothetical protein
MLSPTCQGIVGGVVGGGVTLEDQDQARTYWLNGE